MPQDDKVTEYKDRDFPAIFRDLPKLGSQLKCPNCEHDIFSDDINIDKAIAKCSNCHTVFPFDEEVKDKQWTRRRPEIFQPEGIEMFRLRNELNLDFNWRNTKSNNWFLVLFTIMWNAMLIPFAVGAILSGQFAVLLFMSIHLMVGAGLAANLLSNLINKTTITVDAYNLSIEHRPIRNPFKPNQEIPVSQISQLYVKRKSNGSVNGVPIYGHAVVVLLKNGRKINLIEGVKNSDKALYIEQEIEYFLNIEDRPISGEVR